MGVGELRIRGQVLREGEPVEGAYITLNSGQTFIAERRTGADGVYEFHITPGEWVLICRASNAPAIRREIRRGQPGDFEQNFYLQSVGF